MLWCHSCSMSSPVTDTLSISFMLWCQLLKLGFFRCHLCFDIISWYWSSLNVISCWYRFSFNVIFWYWFSFDVISWYSSSFDMIHALMSSPDTNPLLMWCSYIDIILMSFMIWCFPFSNIICILCRYFDNDHLKTTLLIIKQIRCGIQNCTKYVQMICTWLENSKRDIIIKVFSQCMLKKSNHN